MSEPRKAKTRTAVGSQLVTTDATELRPDKLDKRRSS